jgi:competence protein ComEA
MKKFFNEYLRFGKRDRIGIISLLLLIAIIYCLPRLFARKKEPLSLRQTDFLVKAMDTLANSRNESYPNDQKAASYSSQTENQSNKKLSEGQLFQFDPNLLPAEGWQRLGLSERTSKTIEKYRSKGGKFYKPEDVKKIWGLPEGFYERVKGYITLRSVQKDFIQNAYAKPVYQTAERKTIEVNINKDDTAAFISLPGIGSKLAARIISFREKLGGFYSIDQLGETYGLADSVFKKIRPYLKVDGSLKKLNLNTASKEELKTHPYIKWNLANAIVEYRNQHGNFKSLEELKNISLVDEVTFNKILHYLTL